MQYTWKDASHVEGPWFFGKFKKIREFDAENEIVKELLPFQQQILTPAKNKPPKDGTINWLYDPVGQKGKTELARYVLHNDDAVIIRFGNANDMAYQISQKPNYNLYIFDLSRCKPKNVDWADIYSSIEACRDGLITTNKWKSDTILMNKPWVWVLANEMPQLLRLSSSRWKIWVITAQLNLREVTMDAEKKTLFQESEARKADAEKAYAQKKKTFNSADDVEMQ